MHATYGIPVEVVESLAADHNLRIDRPGFEAEQKTHSAVSRGTTEAAAVFSIGPLDALKREYHHGNEFLGYAGVEADARVIGIIEQNRLAESAPPAKARAWCSSSIGPRSTARLADRSATLARSTRRSVFLRGARHEERKRVHPARGPRG